MVFGPARQRQFHLLPAAMAKAFQERGPVEAAGGQVVDRFRQIGFFVRAHAHDELTDAGRHLLGAQRLRQGLSARLAILTPARNVAFRPSRAKSFSVRLNPVSSRASSAGESSLLRSCFAPSAVSRAKAGRMSLRRWSGSAVLYWFRRPA